MNPGTHSFVKLGWSILIGAVVLSRFAAAAESGRVVINEVMASNGTILSDENGDFPDWIELTNLGSDPVVLDGWGLSDDPDRRFQWVFRDATLAPGGVLTVFASGKDRQPEDPVPLAPSEVPGLRLWLSALAVDPDDPEQVRHTDEGEVYVHRWLDLSGEGNHAVQEDEAQQPAWRNPGSGGHPALNFDGIDDELVLPGPLATNEFCLLAVYRTSYPHEIDRQMRRGTSGVSGQRYLLGARYEGSVNAGAGVSVGTNGVSVYEHGHYHLPAVLVAEFALADTYTVLAVDCQGKVPSIDLQGLWTRSGLQSLRQAVLAPRQIGGGSYGAFAGDLAEVLLFDRALPQEVRRGLARCLADRCGIALPRPRHTNFRLSRIGNALGLTRPDGSLADSLQSGPLPRDVSYGRQPDGTDGWFHFTEATPGAPNTPLHTMGRWNRRRSPTPEGSTLNPSISPCRLPTLTQR